MKAGCRTCTLKGSACRLHETDPLVLERYREDVDYAEWVPNRAPYAVSPGGRF